MQKEQYKTIRYFKAKQLASLTKSVEANEVISRASPEDNFAVLLSINSPAMVEKAINLTTEGFNKVRDLVTID